MAPLHQLLPGRETRKQETVVYGHQTYHHGTRQTRQSCDQTQPKRVEDIILSNALTAGNEPDRGDEEEVR